MNKVKQKTDIYKKVTNNIIKLLENHQTEKFQKTWFSESGEIFANNPTSKATYNGMNQLFLSSIINEMDYTQNRWMTLKQGNNVGAKVKKGEKANFITFYSVKYIDEITGKNITKKVLAIIEKTGKAPKYAKRIPFLKYYLVFNLNQFENVPENLIFKGEKIEYTEIIKNDLAEEILQKSGANIKYMQFQNTIETVITGRTANFYVENSDTITLAARNQFKNAEGFYRTSFHELGHWTGHQHRFNRNLKGEKGSAAYALEELTAELFSAFLCARLGFNSQISNNAAYIKSWLTRLNDDNKFIFKAAAQAEKAVNYVCEIVENGIVLKPNEAV